VRLAHDDGAADIAIRVYRAGGEFQKRPVSWLGSLFVTKMMP
jgi:hypothetical protein